MVHYTIPILNIVCQFVSRFSRREKGVQREKGLGMTSGRREGKWIEIDWFGEGMCLQDEGI